MLESQLAPNLLHTPFIMTKAGTPQNINGLGDGVRQSNLADSSWRDLGEYCHLLTGEIYASGSQSALILCKAHQSQTHLLNLPKDGTSPKFTILNTSVMKR